MYFHTFQYHKSSFMNIQIQNRLFLSFSKFNLYRILYKVPTIFNFNSFFTFKYPRSLLFPAFSGCHSVTVSLTCRSATLEVQ